MNNYFPKPQNGWDWKMNSNPSQIKKEAPNIQTNDQMQMNNQTIKFEDFTQPQQPQPLQELQIQQKQQQLLQQPQQLHQTQQSKLLKFKENDQQQMLLVGLDKPNNKNIHKNQFYKNTQQQEQEQDQDQSQDQQKTEQQPLSEKNAFMFTGNNRNGENQPATFETNPKLEKDFLQNGLEKLTPDQYFDELSIFCQNFKERINQLNLLPRFQSINERKRIQNANLKENDQPFSANTPSEKKRKSSPEISQTKKKKKYNSNGFINNDSEDEDGNDDEFDEQTDDSDKEYHNTISIKKNKYKTKTKTKTKTKYKDKFKTKSSRQPKYTKKPKRTKKIQNKPKAKVKNKPRGKAKPKSRPNFSKPVVKILKEWFDCHTEHPFPTKTEKNILVEDTQLTLKQVNNWFINARRRRKPKDLDQNKNKNQKSKKANK
ncbi:homeobox protein homothorax [Anaeramoeba flamelloides]|uniref:Homeobox protein homothorax n=1 Tax=Anaeramoeba flamelloides TaxID=1746091 RepID=A0ABQ8XV23_9EUKA|nr:homeobox protein homothorax [Anaeramoeba flamelloides]